MIDNIIDTFTTFYDSISQGISIIVNYFMNLVEMTATVLKLLLSIPDFAVVFFGFFPAILSSVFLIVIASAVIKAIFGR